MFYTQNMIPDNEPLVPFECDWTCKHCGRTFHKSQMIPAFLADIWCLKPTVCDECGDDRRQREEAEYNQNAWRIKALKAGVPEKFLDYDKSKANLELLAWVKANWKKSMLITGRYNSCKSRTIAYAVICWHRSDFDVEICYYNWNDLCEKYTALFASGACEVEAFKKELLSFDIIVIDDFGKRRFTPVVEDLTYWLMNKVYESGKRIWITSNETISALASKFDSRDIGEAVISRLDRMITAGDLAYWTDKQ